MNLADFARFGFPADFVGFTDFVLYCFSSAFDVIFLVLVLNIAFSALHEIVLFFGGVKKK